MDDIANQIQALSGIFSSASGKQSPKAKKEPLDEEDDDICLEDLEDLL